MRYLLFFSSLMAIVSCGTSPEITEHEPPLLSQNQQLDISSNKDQKIFASRIATLMRPTYLMQKPGKWSENNKPTFRQKLAVGTQVVVTDTASIGKKKYYFLNTKDHSGWSQDWRIYLDNMYALSINDIILFSKADITKHTQEKLEPGDMFSLDTVVNGEFNQVHLINSENQLKNYWIQSKDKRSLTTDTTDFKLFNLYTQLKDSSNNQVDLLTQVELLEPNETSLIYQMIKKDFGNLDDLDNYLDSLYSDTLESDFHDEEY